MAEFPEPESLSFRTRDRSTAELHGKNPMEKRRRPPAPPRPSRLECPDTNCTQVSSFGAPESDIVELGSIIDLLVNFRQACVTCLQNRQGPIGNRKVQPRIPSPETKRLGKEF